jgi:trimeric autotransporter adhesin
MKNQDDTTRWHVRRVQILLLLAGAMIAGCYRSYAQIVRDSLWVPNGFVSDVEVDGNTIYIGGSFTDVGPSTGGGVLVDDVTGLYDPGYPQVSGFVTAAVPDGSGGWYIGGGFDRVGGFDRENLAHIKSDRTVDSRWNPRANSYVIAMARSGNTVYVGGNFTAIGTRSRKYIAAIPTTSGTPTSWDPHANYPVFSLAIGRGVVYAGGEFDTIGGAYRSRIAAIDSASGAATNWDPDIHGGLFPEVDGLALCGDTVYAGGYFTMVGGEARANIAAIDASTGIATSWNPSANGGVWTLFASPAVVYAGGWFDWIGGSPRSGIAAIDRQTGIATTWDPSPGRGVRTLTVSGTTVYFGGDFLSVGGEQRKRAAAVDRERGQLTGWDPHFGDMVGVISAWENNLYVGGYFTCANGKDRTGIAALDAATGQPTEWNPVVSGESKSVYAIAVDDNTVYLGGSFTSLNGNARNNTGAVSKATGEVQPWTSDADGEVLSLILSGNTVFAQGLFRHIGGKARTTVAALDAASGEVRNWDPLPGDVVRAMALSGNTLYLGGYFLTLGGVQRRFIGAVDALTGVPTDWNPGANSIVWALLLRGGRVYAGGAFTEMGGAQRNRLAALDTETGTVLSWNPGADNDVYALAASDRYIYAGGIFTRIHSSTRHYLAAIDSASGMPSPWNPDLNEWVATLTLSGNVVYTGGAFKFIKGRPHSFFAGIQDEAIVPAVDLTVMQSWNVVSVPVVPADFRRPAVFPSSISQAFRYQPGSGYEASDTLENAVGYWLKFPRSESVLMFGIPLSIDSVAVFTGWNLIGSIASAVPVATIGSIPGGIETSPFYAYGATGYEQTDILTPGRGYWVRANQPGLLVLSSSPLALPGIQIVWTGEVPPPPPGEVLDGMRGVEPGKVELRQNHPNPFNPTTEIGFQIADYGHVLLRVYDMLGREVATLVDEEKEPGTYTVRWDARGVSSGVYFYRLTAGPFTETKRLLFLK